MIGKIPHRAIEKAVEGDWKKTLRPVRVRMVDGLWRLYSKTRLVASFTTEQVALDPTFWQALEKILGWGFSKNHCGHLWPSLTKKCPQCKTKLNSRHNYKNGHDWEHGAHEFLRAHFEGETVLFWKLRLTDE